MELDNRISITVCGDGGCGKSSITLRLVRSQWTSEYDPTIEDSYSVTRTIDGQTYHLALTDTAGQEEYRSLWAASNLRSDAFLLVYDITNPPSLEALDYFYDMISMEEDHRLDSGAVAPVKIVAGNKCDLQGSRVIKSAEGLEWARARRCGFMETSAREMVNIEETFALIVRRVVESRRIHAAGGLPASRGNAHNHTQALPPLGTLSSQNNNITSEQYASGEKPLTTIDPSQLRGRGDEGGGSGGFWSKLKCW